jgi:hypothetical protein
VKTAPKGAIDQLGHLLSRIIHSFAETEDDARIFMAKWDIKDGFWRIDAEDGAEWNFSHVLPQSPGLLFSGSMDRSHLGDHQKIYIFQNFQKLTKLWSVKFESWLRAREVMYHF